MSIPTGPYGPRNDLSSSDKPKFGESSPLKSKLPPGVGRGVDMQTSSKQTLNYMMQPLPASRKDLWRAGPGALAGASSSNAISVDSSSTAGSKNDDIQFIKSNSTSGSSHWSSVNSSSGGGSSGARGSGTGGSSSSGGGGGGGGGWAAVNRRPETFNLEDNPFMKKPTGFLGPHVPGISSTDGTYYGGEYLDAKSTTESLKALLEGINDEPPSRRTRRRVKEQDALEKALAGTPLKKPSEIEIDEGDEEDEEEDGHVEGLKVTLLPHQIRGLDFLLGREDGKNRGGILADDMGLGKTIQSISLILSNPMPSAKTHTTLEREKLKLPSGLTKGTLIVAPTSLIKQWEREIKEKTTGELRVIVHHGPSRTKFPSDLEKYDVVITTPQTLVSEHKDSKETPVACIGVHWWRVIVDEAHTIKNPAAKSSIACCALRARFRWCLTGTPLQNNVDELQALIKFLAIPPFNDKTVWKEQITRPMNNNRGGIAIRRLQVVLRAIMLRRTKAVLQAAANKESESGKAQKDKDGKKTLKLEMVNRKVEEIKCEFGEEEKGFYTKLESRLDSRLEQILFSKGNSYAQVLVLMMRLRQACNHPHLLAGKMNADKEAIFSTQSAGRKPKSKTTSSASSVAGGDDDMDEMADMLGEMSMLQRVCEVCQLELTEDDRANGNIRCKDCREDLMSGLKKLKKQKRPSLAKKKSKKSKKTVEEPDSLADLMKSMEITGDTDQKKVSRKEKNRRRIIDSEDEDEEEDYNTSKDGFIDDEAEESSTLESDEEEGDEEDEEEDSYDSEEDEESEEDDDTDISFINNTQKLFASTKIRRLLKILRRECAEGNKTIVFSSFTSMLDLIEPFLNHERLPYSRYDGSMRNDIREKNLNRLRNEDRCKILLCSLKCGALGLNLTAACRVVILEPFWNPFVEEQAIDRVHRIGQTKDVVVYKLTIQDTIESRILELQNRKRAIADATFGDGLAAFKKKQNNTKLGMKDILYLFNRNAEHGEEAGTHAVDKINASKGSLLKSAPASGGSDWDRSRPAMPEASSRNDKRYDRQPEARRKEDSVYGRK